MRQLRLGIQAKILLGMMSAIVLMAVFFSVIKIREARADLRREQADQREQTVHQAVTLIQLVDSGISSVDLLSDQVHFQNMQTVLARTLPNLRETTFRVKNYDTGQYDVISTNDLDARGTPPNETEMRALDEDEVQTSLGENSKGEPTLYVVGPIHLAGLPIGTVGMNLSLAEQYAEANARYDAQMRDTIRNTVIVAVVAASLVLVLGWAISRAIVKPVKQLTRAAEQISLGNADVEVARASNDEIGDLAESFGRMVTAVKFLKMESESRGEVNAA